MVAMLWVLIPLGGIALAGFTEWLKFKQQTANLGQSAAELTASTAQLTAEIEQLKDDREALLRRLQNLETIVTSEAWETMQSDPPLARAKLLEEPMTSLESDDTKAERIARRLRG